jgi:hypothetical protein
MRYWITGIVVAAIVALGVVAYSNVGHEPQQQQRGM